MRSDRPDLVPPDVIAPDADDEARRYRERLEAEARHFADRVDIHALPDIYHYWSNTYLLPKLVAAGPRDLYDLFADPVRRAAARHAGTVRVASVGAGNCDFELQVLGRVVGEGLTRVELQCWELHESMLERGRSQARELGLEPYARFVQGDANEIAFPDRFDVIIANQSLHHFVKLEHVFAAIREALAPGGTFVTSDMIGRNGHMLWPEAYEVVDALWRVLPDRYKYNHMLQRFEARYDNWDASSDGFEGIRAQDILPLLLEHFEFELFGAFGSFLDVFIGRAFGHNFRRDDPFDRAFVDFAARLEERLLREGAVTPTHLMAWMTVEPPGRLASFDDLDPRACVRDPARPPVRRAPGQPGAA